MADSTLFISETALLSNWKILSNMGGPHATTGAVVKANGYGLGMVDVAKCLWKGGCRTFFVASAEEGIHLADALTPDFPARIVIFGGRTTETDEILWDYELIPALNSLEDVLEWTKICARNGSISESFLHVDTGMNRLGLAPEDFDVLSNNGEDFLKQAGITTLMSHLACADTPEHPLNQQQLAAFKAIHQKVPHLKTSLSATYGLLQGGEFLQDIIRPGIGIYGGVSFQGMTFPFVWKARIAAVRALTIGESVGYNALWRAERPTKIAVVAIGYADGLPRHQSIPFTASLEGYRVPLVGRVSMDMATFDVTDVPEEILERAETIDILNCYEDIALLSQSAQTIPYEILTNIGRRSERLYV